MAKDEVFQSEMFTLRGIWWLPTAPEQQIVGTLSFKPNREFTLCLDGIIDSNRDPFSQEVFRTKIIHGITKNGTECTLLECFEHNLNFGSGFATSEITVNIAVVGAHTGNYEEIRCQSVAVNLTNLEAWVWRTGIRPSQPKSRKGSVLRVDYSHPKVVKYSVPCIESTIALESMFNSSWSSTSHTIQHSERIRLRPRKNRSLDWFLQEILHLRNLLSLFAVERFFYRSVKIQLGRRKEPNLNGKMVRVEADLIMRQAHFSEVRRLLGPDIPFSHPVIKKSLPKIFEIWFSERERLKPVHDLFFGSFYNRDLGIEFEFLSMTQALESLHRRFHRGRYISVKKYQDYNDKLIAAIPESAPHDLRAALKSRVRYGNEFSLRKRLNLMGKQLSKKSKEAVDPDFANFVSAVVDTRNHLTHHDPNPDQNAKIMNQKEMIIATFNLRLLLTFFLFKRIGVPEKSIIESIIKHHRFQRPKIL